MSTDTLPRTRTLNCGHESTPRGHSPGFAFLSFADTYWQRSTNTDYTMCYQCHAADTLGYTMRVLDQITLYLSEGDWTVVTWPGCTVGKVTRRTVGRMRINVQVRDNNGRMWHGVAPVANGTYVTLRAYKGR